MSNLQLIPLSMMSGANRAYLGAYVSKIRSKRGYAGEFQGIFLAQNSKLKSSMT